MSRKRQILQLLPIAVLFCLIVLLFGIFLHRDASEADGLVVLNYGAYIEGSVIESFEEKTGIHVVLEEYETAESMYAKYKSGSIGYDLICSADYIIEKLIGEGEVLALDKANIPNEVYLDKRYTSFAEAFDPGGEHVIPYFLGTVGILYNKKYVDKKDVLSWSVLWDEKYKNKIIMENSVRDSLIPALRLSGHSINTTDKKELSEAFSLLGRQKHLNYAYLSDESMYEMIMENANLALIYSGEANAAMLKNENLAYYVPKEGSNLWMDAWFIPKTCRHKEEAEEFLNYLCDPDIAYKNWDEVYYTTPNKGVYDMLDDEEKKDKSMFPGKKVLNRCEVFKALSDEESRVLYKLWKELKVGV